mgnify:CR=1 FL=1
MDDELIIYGGEVKALGNGKVGGYLVRFSDKDNPDLDGDYFTRETEFGPHNTTPVYYHHGLDKRIGKRILDDDAVMREDDVGIWIESQLALRDEYEKEIYGLVEAGKMGWSSGTAGHLVEREPMGKSYWIKRWMLGLDASLTPTPAEPKNSALALKSLIAEVEPEAEEKAGEVIPQAAEADAIDTNLNTKIYTNGDNKEMNDKELNKEQTAEIEKDSADIAEIVRAAVKEAMPKEEVKEEVKVSGAALVAPAVKKVSGLGFSHDETDGFLHWVKTGKRNSTLKTDLQEGDETEGGYLVPEDFYAQIIGKRNEISVPRRAGARVIQTSRDKVDVPVEGTQASFAFSNEESAYTASTLEFSQVGITVYKATLLVKISEELLEDNAANLESWLSAYVGDRAGVHENTYAIGGNGTTQPQGVLVGGTAGLTLDDTNAIAAAEIPELFYKLKEQYMPNASWCMEQATMGFLMGLSGNQFQLFTPPAGPGSPWNLWGKPVYPADAMESCTTTKKKCLVIGDWNYYALVERAGLSVQRNPYLYSNTGQVGFFFKYRWGGAVLQAEAFQYATTA